MKSAAPRRRQVLQRRRDPRRLQRAVAHLADNGTVIRIPANTFGNRGTRISDHITSERSAWDAVDSRPRVAGFRRVMPTATHQVRSRSRGRRRPGRRSRCSDSGGPGARRCRWSSPRGDAYVVGTLDGSPRNPRVGSQMFQRRVDKARQALGSDAPPVLTLHGLPRPSPTGLLEAGENVKVVQERLGHTPITTTIDVYSRLRRPVRDRPESAA